MADHDRTIANRARTGRGSDAFAYDPSRRASDQSGLDRLRCISDREIAELLFKLYGHIEERERAASAFVGRARPRAEQRLEGLRMMGRRALAGELGQDLQDLAEGVLRDESGRERTDDESLHAFGRILATFRRIKE